MSRTKMDALRLVAVLIGFAVAVTGCSTLPKSNQNASSSSRPDFSEDDEESGRLFRWGQNSASKPQSDNQVQQASLDRSLPEEVSEKSVAAAAVDAVAEEDDGFDLEDLDPMNVYRANTQCPRLRPR